MTGNKDKSIIFRCTEALYKKVKRYADMDNVSKADFIRTAIEKHIDDRRIFHDIKEVSSES